MPHRPASRSLLAAATALLPLLAPPLAAQTARDNADAERSAAVVEAMREWMNAFEHGRLQPGGTLRRGADLQPRYASGLRRSGLLLDGEEERITHLDALEKMLAFAEQHPSAELADVVLGVAAAGLEESFLDHDALLLRDLGHWSLMRMDNQGAWFLVLRAAAGERVPLLSDLRPVEIAPAAEGIAVGPARRVAALHLLGGKNLPVFRSTLEAALGDADPRVRLAAAEAMSPPWRPGTLNRIAEALAREHHPVVSQALVRMLTTMLQAPPPDLLPEVKEVLVGGALLQFGRCGWRTDMDLLDLVAAFPRKDAIPVLIRALDLEVHSPDALVSAINKRASPLLRERAAGLLRAMTGSVTCNDDPVKWRAFWQAEHANIVVPEKLSKPGEGNTRATFFGVPVTGGSIAFLIDTSGSMEEACTTPTTGPRGRESGGSRLAIAKEQLVLAVQAMPAESQFSVLTFSDRGRCWTAAPIKPGPRNLRSLTELLSRLQPRGGTNLFDGLSLALQWSQHRYGGAATPAIDELFVLSDGEPTAGEVRDTDALLQVVKEANKYARVRINTVFTGNGGGADLLRRLAEENGGVFVTR